MPGSTPSHPPGPALLDHLPNPQGVLAGQRARASTTVWTDGRPTLATVTMAATTCWPPMGTPAPADRPSSWGPTTVSGSMASLGALMGAMAPIVVATVYDPSDGTGDAVRLGLPVWPDVLDAQLDPRRSNRDVLRRPPISSRGTHRPSGPPWPAPTPDQPSGLGPGTPQGSGRLPTALRALRVGHPVRSCSSRWAAPGWHTVPAPGGVPRSSRPGDPMAISQTPTHDPRRRAVLRCQGMATSNLTGPDL